MKITKTGAMGTIALLMMMVWLFTTADQATRPHVQPAVHPQVVATVWLAPDPAATPRITSHRPVPDWLSCNTIDASEFPYRAGLAWAHCYENINRYHARWQFVGHYDGQHGIWAIAGPTTVYVTKSGWWETS